jgi:hypothetical protein
MTKEEDKLTERMDLYMSVIVAAIASRPFMEKTGIDRLTNDIELLDKLAELACESILRVDLLVISEMNTVYRPND